MSCETSWWLSGPQECNSDASIMWFQHWHQHQSHVIPLWLAQPHKCNSAIEGNAGIMCHCCQHQKCHVTPKQFSGLQECSGTIDGTTNIMWHQHFQQKCHDTSIWSCQHDKCKSHTQSLKEDYNELLYTVECGRQGGSSKASAFLRNLQKQ